MTTALIGRIVNNEKCTVTHTRGVVAYWPRFTLHTTTVATVALGNNSTGPKTNIQTMTPNEAFKSTSGEHRKFTMFRWPSCYSSGLLGSQRSNSKAEQPH